MKKEFLLELGVEELPARFIIPAVKQLKQSLAALFTEEKIQFGSIECFSTPRRLTVLAQDIALKQEDSTHTVKGPAKKAAFADGVPTKAAQGFARSQGVAVEDLRVDLVGGVEYIFADRFQKGKTTAACLAQSLPGLVGEISFPKTMRWGDGDTRFARPIRWIVCLLGSDIVPFTFAGVQSDRKSFGHRQLTKGQFAISTPSAYCQVLEDNYVIADTDRRRKLVKEQAQALAVAVSGMLIADDQLLDEVTHLVEYPTAFRGSFSAEFLEVPEAVLITTMKEHQRYFAIADNQDKLLPYFIGVRNGADNHLELVCQGNEKVLAARLADARFFFKEDTERPLDDNTAALRQVVFQEGLGTMYDKTMRLQELVPALGSTLNIAVDDALGRRAAFLAKADLVSHMVGEFPELQGVMGSTYAALNGEDSQVVTAIAEHYRPRFSGDSVPEGQLSVLLSLADKLDTLVGYFHLGKIPTGSQDPFALRRQALGVVQILLAHNLSAPMATLIDMVVTCHGFEASDDGKESLLEFFKQRLKSILLEKAYNYDSIDAVLATAITSIPAMVKKVQAIEELRKSAEMEDLLTVHGRAVKLAAKAADGHVQSEWLTESDASLWKAIQSVETNARQLLASGEYVAGLNLVASLRPTIDQYFEETMIMADDPNVRNNRLAMLRRLIDLLMQFADFQLIVNCE